MYKKHELRITVDFDGAGFFKTEVEDVESGKKTSFDYPFSFDEHPDFDEIIGKEIYGWISRWAESSGAVGNGIVNIGTFDMTTPVMRVSDPCYNKDVWCSGTVENCHTGTWEAAIMQKNQGEWGIRNAAIAARFSGGHVEFEDIFESWKDGRIEFGMDQWKECDFEVGVDSGQAGFFDEANYQNAVVFEGMPEAKHKFGDEWYNHCCDATLGIHGAGIIPFGAVTSSGYGDGGYSAYKHTNAEGIVDAMLIIFIDDDEDDDEDDD